jgi:hypothetical protein
MGWEDTVLSEGRWGKRIHVAMDREMYEYKQRMR